ncbi:MAG: hypothetical protein FWB86_12130 [Treponema sp.]|nr:hypothetical protein [Treponema sp.]MCL2252568.1 hypothetical protein [Treponema sp.]
MKKFFYFGILCLILFALTACTTVTTTPFIYTNNTNTEFEILGEVVYESETRPGFIEFLKAARKLYPDCDYVIDIMVDQIETSTVFIMLLAKRNKFIMRGVAIKYKM